MALLSQALQLGYLLSPHRAFQGHAAHTARWPAMLSPNGSSDTCISDGVFHIPMPCFHGALPVYPKVLLHFSIMLHGAAQGPGTRPESLPTHIVAAFRIEEMAVPHVEHKIVFRAKGDWSVGIEAPDHGVACDVHMHDEFVAHDFDEQYCASDDIVSVGVRASVP